MSSVQWLIEPCLIEPRSCCLTKTKIDELSSFSENLTFNFNSLLGIVYVSFSMQFPTSLEECDFDRQFLFDEYVAISHRYDLKKAVSLKS
jgi:hypothetical protein